MKAHVHDYRSTTNEDRIETRDLCASDGVSLVVEHSDKPTSTMERFRFQTSARRSRMSRHPLRLIALAVLSVAPVGAQQVTSVSEFRPANAVDPFAKDGVMSHEASVAGMNGAKAVVSAHCYSGLNSIAFDVRMAGAPLDTKYIPSQPININTPDLPFSPEIGGGSLSGVHINTATPDGYDLETHALVDGTLLLHRTGVTNKYQFRMLFDTMDLYHRRNMLIRFSAQGYPVTLGVNLQESSLGSFINDCASVTIHRREEQKRAEEERKRKEEVERRIAEEKRRLEEERKRQFEAKLQKELNSGNEALDAGNYDIAGAFFQQVLTEAPDNAAAKAGLDQTQQAQHAESLLKR